MTSSRASNPLPETKLSNGRRHRRMKLRVVRCCGLAGVDVVKPRCGGAGELLGCKDSVDGIDVTGLGSAWLLPRPGQKLGLQRADLEVGDSIGITEYRGQVEKWSGPIGVSVQESTETGRVQDADVGPLVPSEVSQELVPVWCVHHLSGLARCAGQAAPHTAGREARAEGIVPGLARDYHPGALLGGSPRHHAPHPSTDSGLGSVAPA